ncbi:MAG: copper chaperone PCu(A)C [Rhodospirillales bacterium]|nr:MAG: copper chaperone PCu(A)C [Rhodospirillales bacterium]
MLATGALPLAAGEYQIGDIRINDPWARPSPPGARAGAAYMDLHNLGTTDDSLVEASAPVAATTELHTHEMDGDVMRMRRIDAVEVPAGGTATLEPGGLHVMLINLRSPLVEGESIPLMLRFANAGEITIDVAVRQPSDGQSDAAEHGYGHGHGHGHGHDHHHGHHGHGDGGGSQHR